MRRKKVLALVLTLALALSVAAGAAFTDQKQIKNTEAVDMCVALNIISGYPDGSYKPGGNITRAEFTKMLCVALNGGKEPTLGTAVKSTFTDVRTSANSAWAEKYIESCVSQGIVSGIGGGKFAPNNNVTGSEAAKMLLVALGYKSENEGFTGSAWEVNVNVVATSKGLYEDLEGIDTSKALTRDNAAQMVWNALKAYMVSYVNEFSTVNGQLVATQKVADKTNSNGDKVTLMYDKYSAIDNEYGVMTGFTYNSDKDEWTYEFNQWKVTDSNKVYDKTFTSSTDYTDLFGQTVKVIYDKKTNGDVNNVYGMFAKDAVVVATGIVGDLDTVSDNDKKVKLDGTEYKTDKALSQTDVTVFHNGTLSSSVKEPANLSALIAVYKDKAAYSVKLIDDDNNGKVDTVVIVPTIVEKVTYVGSARVTAGQSYKFDDCNIYKGIAKGDFAVIVKAAFTATDEDTLTKAELVKGDVTGVKTGKVKVDGKWYTLTNGAKAPEVGDTVQMAVVGSFAYDVDTTVGASKDILLISMAKKPNNDLNYDYTIDARAYFPDGTNAKITVDKIAGNDVTKNDELTENVMYTYSKDKDGNYELKLVGPNNLAGADSYTTGAYSAANDTIGGKKIADNAVIFVVSKDDNKIKVKTGKAVKDWATTTKATVKGALVDEINSLDYITYAALYVDGKQPSASGDLLYAYLTADCYQTKVDGDKVTAYEVWNGTKDVVLYEDSTTNAGKFEAGTAIAYREDGSYIKDISTLKAFSIKGFDGKSEGDIDLVPVVGSAASYTLDKDCVVLAINDKDIKGVEGNLASVSLAQKNAAGDYIPNAYIAINDKGKIAAIVYDEQGQLDEYSYMDKNTLTTYAVAKATLNANDFTGCKIQTTSNSNNVVVVSIIKEDDSMFASNGKEFKLDVVSAGKTTTLEGVKSADGKTISFTFTATADVTSMTAHKGFL